MNNISDKTLVLAPHGLISLWDMIQFPAHPLLNALMDLNWLKEYLSDTYSPPDPTDRNKWPTRSKLFGKTVGLIGEVAKELELTETTGRCSRFCRIILDSTTEILPGTGLPAKMLTTPQILLEIEGIEESLQKELISRKFVYVPVSKAVFCEQTVLFGESVNKAFPSAAQDIKDAGNCLAGDLNTGAVFYLMRVVEVGMRSLAVHLRVKIKDRPIKHAGWDQLIKLVEKEIRLRREKYDKSKRKNRNDLELCKFYAVIADELNVFKEIWRDKVMHTGPPYNWPEALGVFMRVMDFMQRLATKVSETNS